MRTRLPAPADAAPSALARHFSPFGFEFVRKPGRAYARLPRPRDITVPHTCASTIHEYWLPAGVPLRRSRTSLLCQPVVAARQSLPEWAGLCEWMEPRGTPPDVSAARIAELSRRGSPLAALAYLAAVAKQSIATLGVGRANLLHGNGVTDWLVIFRRGWFVCSCQNGESIGYAVLVLVRGESWSGEI